MEYEELPLFIHRDFREVIVHHDGHKPPLLKKEQTASWINALREALWIHREAAHVAGRFSGASHESRLNTWKSIVVTVKTEQATLQDFWMLWRRDGPSPQQTTKTTHFERSFGCLCCDQGHALPRQARGRKRARKRESICSAAGAPLTATNSVTGVCWSYQTPSAWETSRRPWKHCRLPVLVAFVGVFGSHSPALEAMQARGEPLESKGEPFVSGGTPPKPLQRLELLAKVCQASPEIFQKAAAASDLEVQHVLRKQVLKDPHHEAATQQRDKRKPQHIRIQIRSRRGTETAAI